MSQSTLLLVAIVILVDGAFAISAPSKDPTAEARLKLARKVFEETLAKGVIAFSTASDPESTPST